MNGQMKDGGPAFPLGSSEHVDGVHYGEAGMTLRDYFAAKYVVNAQEITLELAKAIMGSVTPTSDGSPEQIIAIYKWWAEAESRYKFMHADAMIAAREVQS